MDICESCKTKIAVHGKFCQFCQPPSGQFIQGREVKPDDIGSPVTYIPNHANGDTSHKDCEFGTISSYNDTYVFVKFHSPNGQACRAENLVWG